MAISDLVVKFGAAGSPQTVTMVEQLYATFPVGFGSNTQEKWRSDPITINGIPFTVFSCVDSNGRASVEIYAAFGEASAQQTWSNINRQTASVDLQITYNGVAQNLWGAGTTYSYDHQRCCFLRWQSETLPWDTSHAFLQSKIADGTFLAHNSANPIGGTEDSVNTNLPTTAAYQPFKVYSTFDQTQYIGSQHRGNTVGAERPGIGPAHEYLARLVSELGTNDRQAWLTATRAQVIKDLAETAGQFPHCYMDPATNRVLDPSAKPHCSHNNATAWFTATGIPQPGSDTASTVSCSYDMAHPLNKFSFYAYHLTRDPYHLLHTQIQASTALTFQSLNASARGADGKLMRIVPDQEREIAWGLQMLTHAWHATPGGTVPKPFLSKAYFEAAIDNTLDWVREKLISSATHIATGSAGEGMRYWRIMYNISTGSVNNEYRATHFMEDYNNIVLAQMALLGYTKARDVLEWHAANIQRRLELGGSWFLNDYELEVINGVNSGPAAYAVTPTTGSLPYTNAAEFKAWYPRPGGYANGTIDRDHWLQQYGRDTFLFLAAVNVTKEVQQRGLMTYPYNFGTAESELVSRFSAPYYSREIYAKQFYSYSTQAALPAPADSFTGTAGAAMYFGRTA